MILSTLVCEAECSRKRVKARPCSVCGGTGLCWELWPDGRQRTSSHCPQCQGCGWSHIDPDEPCPGAPGSGRKVATLAARYAAGLELWQDADASFEKTDLPAELSRGLIADDEDGDDD